MVHKITMRYVLKILNWFVDCFLAWFTPTWRRKGCEARAAVSRYYHYNRPHISEDRKTQIEDLLSRLREALLFWRRDEVKKITEEAQNLGELLRGFKRSAVVETVESFFVIMVIFLGIRTYYAQPFRIPTGSMQPTLNGITIKPLSDAEEMPAAPTRWWQAITLGSSYSNIVADNAKRIVNLQTERYCLLFTRTRIYFSDGSQETVPCASGAVAEYLRDTGKLGRMLMPGETIVKARFDAGDMVVVNRMAYHFRAPRRGETFVFDTRAINTEIPAAMPDQSRASFYIKRLCGLPGDRISISAPHLIVNGKKAEESTIARVAACTPPYNATGYNALNRLRDAEIYYQAYLTEGNTITLRNNPATPDTNEYLALGDNTVNSKDSRYWGPVRQFNVLGPAFLTLWPFSSHWGGIE